MLVPDGDISQTPSPSATTISAQTAANRRMPPSAARKPRTSSGTLFAATWAKPKWTKAAGTTSTSSDGVRGTMPKPSSACPLITSATSSSHSSATQPAISLAAVSARSPRDTSRRASHMSGMATPTAQLVPKRERLAPLGRFPPRHAG